MEDLNGRVRECGQLIHGAPEEVSVKSVKWESGPLELGTGA